MEKSTYIASKNIQFIIAEEHEWQDLIDNFGLQKPYVYEEYFSGTWVTNVYEMAVVFHVNGRRNIILLRGHEEPLSHKNETTIADWD